MTTADLEPLNELRRTGETLPPRLHRNIIALGEAAVPPLLALLDDDAAATEDAPGDGWPPIHAVSLLAELRATAAIPIMLRIMRETDTDAIIHDRVVSRLKVFGAAAFEPTLAMAADTKNPRIRDDISCVLADIGVRDERVFKLLCETFDRWPDFGASLLGSYGDPRAVAMLARAIEGFRPDFSRAWGMMELNDFIDAYEELAGPLPEALADHVEALRADWDEHLARVEAAATTSPVKVGRNDACPCGSGKKYKRCCIDQAAP